MPNAAVPEELPDILLTVPIFSGLGRAAVDQLIPAGKTASHRSGQIIFLEGDEGDTAYVVISGKVDLTVTSSAGEQILLHQCGPRSYFGELALLDGQPRSATAMASEPTVTFAVRREDLFRYLRSNPEAGILMLQTLSRTLRRADEKIKQLGFLGVAGRLARVLLDLDEESQGSGIAVRHDQLAAMVGSRRPTVSTLLGSWRDSGILRTGRARIVVEDRKALEALAEL